jgi:hypothetical protein
MGDMSIPMTPAAEQRTAAWHAERAGKFTGSKFVDLVARNKKTGEKLAAWDNLIWQVVTERMTGVQDEGPDSFSLRWGREVEPYACEAYELATGNIVTKSAFVTHPQYPFAGASPDGLIGIDGGLEMKSPKNSRVHLERFMTGMPDDIRPQVQGNIWVTAREWWDFVSYDPRMPESHRLLRIRINRDEAFIKLIEQSVLEAEEEACALLDRLQRIAA